MPTNLHTHDLIQQLKAIKEEQHLTPQRICEMLDAANCHVSLNTVKKVFAEGSEDQHFRFHDTLQPISRVLLGIYGEDKDDSEINALHAAIRVKDELIEQRERELTECREEHARRTEFLLRQIELKDQRIDTLMSRVTVLLEQLQRLLDKCDNCPVKRSDDHS
jgi:hypothetical protein